MNSVPPTAWYYPKYTCYSIFAVLSVAYTAAVHALFHLRLLSKPQIQDIVTSRIEKNDTLSHSISKRVAVVTGSNTGVGYWTARQLVVDYGMDVILACRSPEKARVAAETINAAAQKQEAHQINTGRAIFLQLCDLSSLASVRAFAKAVHDEYDTIHVLVNNAGLNTTARTSDGYDLLFQAAFLGHFLLTNLLFGLFPEDGSGRIVNLSSVKHHFQSNYLGHVTLDETFWRNSALLHHKRNESYPNAKQAAIFFTLEMNRRFNSLTGSGDGGDTIAKGGDTTAKIRRTKTKRTKQVRTFAANPGAVNSDIWRSVNFPGLVIPLFQRIFLTTQQGSATSVAAAVGGNFEDSDYYLQPYWMPASARYMAPFPVLEMLGPFVGYRVTQPRLPPTEGGIRSACAALWKVSEELTHLQFDGVQSTICEGISANAVPRTVAAAPNSKSAPLSSQNKAIKVDESSSRPPPARTALGLINNTAPTKKKCN